MCFQPLGRPLPGGAVLENANTCSSRHPTCTRCWRNWTESCATRGVPPTCPLCRSLCEDEGDHAVGRRGCGSSITQGMDVDESLKTGPLEEDASCTQASYPLIQTLQSMLIRVRTFVKSPERSHMALVQDLYGQEEFLDICKRAILHQGVQGRLPADLPKINVQRVPPIFASSHMRGVPQNTEFLKAGSALGKEAKALLGEEVEKPDSSTFAPFAELIRTGVLDLQKLRVCATSFRSNTIPPYKVPYAAQPSPYFYRIRTRTRPTRRNWRGGYENVQEGSCHA